MGVVQFSGKIAGEEEEQFRQEPGERVRWALRQLYYEMREYKLNYGSYTDDPEVLGIRDIDIEGMEFNPDIEVTTRMFEVSIPGIDGEQTWHIRQDGRVWSE